MPYVFAPAAPPTLAIAGADACLPVRRIFCIGRNYAAHAREMGRDPDREPPFFFFKPADCVVADGATVSFPAHTQELHHEAELAVVLGQGGSDIAAARALDHVWGYAAGNDLTCRDVQAAAKARARPWDMAKGFDHSAPIGPVSPVSVTGHPTRGAITAHVNGELRQSGDLSEMIWSVPEIIATLSRAVRLAAGDVILTGTPAGVGPLVAGDTCVVTIAGVGSCTTHIGARA